MSQLTVMIYVRSAKHDRYFSAFIKPRERQDFDKSAKKVESRDFNSAWNFERRRNNLLLNK